MRKWQGFLWSRCPCYHPTVSSPEGNRTILTVTHKTTVSSNRLSAISVEVLPPDECLRGEGLVWLIGAVVCLLAATAGPMSVSVGSGWLHVRCSIIGSCQSTATSEIVKACCCWSTM